LRKNLRDYGLSPHGTGMKAIAGESPDITL
jgi:hypothetical protein